MRHAQIAKILAPSQTRTSLSTRAFTAPLTLPHSRLSLSLVCLFVCVTPRGTHLHPSIASVKGWGAYLDVKSVFCVFEHGLENTCIFVYLLDSGLDRKHTNWVHRAAALAEGGAEPREENFCDLPSICLVLTRK